MGNCFFSHYCWNTGFSPVKPEVNLNTSEGKLSISGNFLLCNSLMTLIISDLADALTCISASGASEQLFQVENIPFSCPSSPVRKFSSLFLMGFLLLHFLVWRGLSRARLWPLLEFFFASWVFYPLTCSLQEISFYFSVFFVETYDSLAISSGCRAFSRRYSNSLLLIISNRLLE